jgi:hypothetical protein
MSHMLIMHCMSDRYWSVVAQFVSHLQTKEDMVSY